jgi:YidC/Oxa1 family membrane protein insertase
LGNLFGFIEHPLELGLIWLSISVNSAGIGIILFTIFVRLVLAPLTVTQLRNTKKMQKIQPLLQELKAKHGKDRAKMTQETMALYKEHEVNPAMGCLPMVLQFPILIGLFYSLNHLGQTPFNMIRGRTVFGNTTCNGHPVHLFTGWLQQCYSVSGAAGTPLQAYNLFHSQFLWLSNGLGHSDPLFILPLLAGATQWIQTRMVLTRSTDPNAQMMNTMMNFMPLMIIFFASRYSSGLSLYWVTSTTIGILLQARFTGWGLMPRPATVLAFFGSRGTRPSASVRSRPAPKMKKQLAGSAPPKSSQEVADANGITDVEQVNEAPRNGATATPVRRKANRAKGGRKGGRRG